MLALLEWASIEPIQAGLTSTCAYEKLLDVVCQGVRQVPYLAC